MPPESLPGVGPNLAASQLARLREKLDNAELRQKQLEDDKKRARPPTRQPGQRNCRQSRRGSSPSSKATPPSPDINRQVASWQKQLNYRVELSGDPNEPGVKELKQKITEAAQERERIRKERIEEFQKTQLQEVARKLQADDEKIDSDLATSRSFRKRRGPS